MYIVGSARHRAMSFAGTTHLPQKRHINSSWIPHALSTYERRLSYKRRLLAEKLLFVGTYVLCATLDPLGAAMQEDLWRDMYRSVVDMTASEMDKQGAKLLTNGCQEMISPQEQTLGGCKELFKITVDAQEPASLSFYSVSALSVQGRMTPWLTLWHCSRRMNGVKVPGTKVVEWM